ncbi:transposase [Methanobrevibacter oralis]
MHLPPHSPHLNPIEQVWKSIKSIWHIIYLIQ